LILALALVAAAMLQTTLASRPIILGARPDLVLLIVVSFGVAQGVSEGLLAGTIGGLVVDLLSATPFGAATIGLGLVGFLTGLGDTNVYRANLFIPPVAVFLATVMYHSFLMLSLQGDGRTVEWLSTLALQTVPGAFLNAVLAPFATYFIRRITSPGDPEERFQW
jgi:rod shape-determining protein MreD